MNQIDEGAYHTDLHMYLIYDYPVPTKQIALDYCYICSLAPCTQCVNQINEPGLRPLYWRHSCDFCGNYIEFRKVPEYYKVVTRYGKDIESISEYKFIHFHAKSNVYFKLMGKPESADEPQD